MFNLWYSHKVKFILSNLEEEKKLLLFPFYSTIVFIGLNRLHETSETINCVHFKLFNYWLVPMTLNRILTTDSVSLCKHSDLFSQWVSEMFYS